MIKLASLLKEVSIKVGKNGESINGYEVEYFKHNLYNRINFLFFENDNMPNIKTYFPKNSTV